MAEHAEGETPVETARRLPEARESTALLALSTEGPWEASQPDEDVAEWLVINEGGETIAVTFDPNDAEMIAAAPRLLAALVDQVDELTALDLAFLHAGFGYTFESGKGLVLREDGRGCPIWYRAEDRDRAFTDADAPGPRVHWETLTASPPTAPSYAELAERLDEAERQCDEREATNTRLEAIVVAARGVLAVDDETRAQLVEAERQVAALKALVEWFHIYADDDLVPADDVLRTTLALVVESDPGAFTVKPAADEHPFEIAEPGPT